MSILSSLQALQTYYDPEKSYWEVVLNNGKVITEHKLVLDLRRGGYRAIDWALDLNSTGDLRKIKELWLKCPNDRQAMLKIEEPGTVFQFKHRTRDAMGQNILQAQCIGKVTNKEEGTCECYIYDRVLGLIAYKSNVNNFGSWRPDSGLIPPKILGQDVTGLRLG